MNMVRVFEMCRRRRKRKNLWSMNEYMTNNNKKISFNLMGKNLKTERQKEKERRIVFFLKLGIFVAETCYILKKRKKSCYHISKGKIPYKISKEMN